MENPWAIKRRIDTALIVAERYGFELRENGGHAYGAGRIFLFAKPDNDVFSKGVVLNTFDAWEEVMTFFLGYEKADLAHKVEKVKSKGKK